MERAIVYLERMAHKFAEHHGAVLRQLGVTQEALGELYRERNMPTRADHFFALAEATLRESLEVEDSTAGHAVLAELLIRRHKDLEEAEIHLNIAKSKGTTTTEEAVIEADLGNIYLERNLLREALQHFQHAADLDPNLEDVWFKIGYIQRNLNQLEDAIVAYERTIEIQPQYIPAYTELCAIYVDQGQLPKARKVLERGLRSNPKSAHLLALLSSVYLESDDLRHARAVLEEAEHINPNLEIVQAMREALNRYRKK
jgi:tetratricopeptide (TPR) repeat protein